MKKIAVVVFCLLTLMPAKVFAAGYFDLAARDLVRGTKNIVSAPAEIPIAIGESRAKPGQPVIRELTGFTDGTFRMLARMGSGGWDFVSMLIPGMQEGLPVEPETLS